MDKKEKLAFLAGLIEGEGNIGVYKSIEKEVEKYRAFLAITNTNKELLDWVQKEFSGSIYTNPRGGNNKQQHVWRLSGKKQYNILKQIEKYLIVKKEQAKLNIMYYEKVGRWTWHGKGKSRPIWVKKYQEECYQKTLELNHTGLCHELPE